MKNLIKSPLNYVGGKYKLLPQLLPLFPDDIHTFVDLFCGGANVSVNIKAQRIIATDKQPEVIDFLNACIKLESKEMVDKIYGLIDKYNLSKTNKEGYLKLRNDYNRGNKTWDMFYALVCYSFNNQIRFNSKGEFNMPFGKNRSSFNPTLKQKFIEFVDTIKTIHIKFLCKDFRELKPTKLANNDFVYCDPPYLITCASYNESGGWGISDEEDLLNLLDELNDKGIRFALSNVLESKGNSNDLLKKWAKRYRIHKIEAGYGNCNYQRRIKNNRETKEVLITNY